MQPPASSGLRGRRQAALSPAAASWSQLSTSGCRRLRLCPWAVAQLCLPVPGERRAGGAPGCLAAWGRAAGGAGMAPRARRLPRGEEERSLFASNPTGQLVSGAVQS